MDGGNGSVPAFLGSRYRFMNLGGDIIQWATQTVFQKGQKTLYLYLVLDDENLRSVDVVFGEYSNFSFRLEDGHGLVRAPLEEFEDCLRPLKLSSQGSFSVSISDEKAKSGFVDVSSISFNGGVGLSPLFGLSHIGSGA